MNALNNFKTLTTLLAPPKSISFMLNRDFIEVLKFDEPEEITDERITQLIFSTQNCKHALIAACFVKLNKLDLICELYNQKYTLELSEEQLRAFEDLVSAFFLMDIFVIMFHYYPLGIPQLVAFQKRMVSTSTVSYCHGSKTALQERLRNLDADPKFSDTSYEPLYLLFFDYLVMLHPLSLLKHNNDDFDKAYASSLSQIFFQIPSYSPYSPPIMNLILKTSYSQSETVYQLLNDWFFLSKGSFFDKFSDIFKKLFSHHALCSFAFKENNNKFLRFCDVQRSIDAHPDYFF